MSLEASTEQQKNLIRQEIRQLRQSISAETSFSAGKSAASNLESLPEFEKAKQIACFLSFDGEIDTSPVIELIQKRGKTCLLPYLRPSKPNRLWFLPFYPGDKMKKNRYGIPEVDKGSENAVRISQIDTILMPLVAFDIEGNRLGMGGGFYDATLAYLKEPEFENSRPSCLGFAFEKQKVNSIPCESWDYKIDAVVTDSKIYRF